MENIEEKGASGGRDDYTRDGSVDLKGRPVLRNKTGRWKACSFIVTYEAFERMAFYGIASNLVVYLTEELHQGTVTASNNVTNLSGTVWLTPILGAYIADSFLGRYWTFVIASFIYLAGMSLLTLSVSVPGLKPPTCKGIKDKLCDKRPSSFQVGIFFFALYTIAVGTGGTKPNISTMGADQFDDFEPKERTQKLSFFNWWMFGIFFGALFSNTFLVYIQDNVSWGVGYGIPTAGLAISVIVFLVGTRLYRHKIVSGSPLTTIARVLVAAVRKYNVRVPNDSKELYELGLEEYAASGNVRIDHTSSLRFLDKAAVKTGSSSPWMLCPVTQVEETKQMVKMLPVLAVTFIPSTLYAQVHTLFIKQGTTLNRHMGPHFQIPPASLTAFVTIFMLISIVVYDQLFVPFVRRFTKNPRGLTLLQRMAIGFTMHLMILILACIVERKRLTVARANGIVGKFDTVPLSIFILLPQFALTGIADCFAEVAKLEFFYDQAPDSMKSIGTSYFTTSLGVGSFLSSFLLKTTSTITKRNGHHGWVLDNLNISRLDYYYAFLTVLVFLNFIVFLLVAKYFVYNVDVTEVERNLEMDAPARNETYEDEVAEAKASSSPNPDASKLGNDEHHKVISQ